MTNRDNEFDVSTIPLLASLTAAGTVSSDGLAESRAAARAALLEQIDRVASSAASGVEDRPNPRTPRGVTLRLLGVAAAAVLVAGGLVLWPSVSPGPSGAAVAISADGQLSCPSSGFAHAIKPADADVRLLPSALPAGWKIDSIYARWQVNDGPAACTRASLAVARLAPNGVVSALAQVYGPFNGIDSSGFLGTRSSAVVDGNRALTFTSAGDYFNRWVWTDGGNSWLMESLGFTASEVAKLPGGVRTEGSDVVWDASADTLGLTLTHQRTGDPYTYRDEHLAWYINFSNAEGEAIQIYADDRTRNRRSTKELLRLGMRPGEAGTASEEWSTEEPRFYSYSLTRPDGITISAQNYSQFGNGEFSKRAPENVVREIVNSLVPVPATDPRLQTFALDEETVPHP